MHRRPVMLMAIVVAWAVVATSCDGSADDPAKEGESVRYAEDGTLTMAIADDRGAFDPYRSLTIDVAKLAYDPLVHIRSDGSLASGLAEEWTADTRSATFTLRPDVTCSDGTALTASQVAASLRFATDLANEELIYGSPLQVPVSITADDAARTVEIDVDEPVGFLLESIGQVPIVCAKGLEDPKVFETASDGTGPFVLTGVDPGQSYTFTRRNDYAWGPDGASTSEPGTPKTVVLRIIANETTAANLLLSGEINFAKIQGDDRQRLDAQGLDRIEVPSPAPWLQFNQIGDHPGADLRVRQALVHALDLDELIAVSTGGSGSPATGLINFEPRVCPGNTIAGLLPEHDVAAAEALLDEAGWIEGSDGIREKGGTPLALDLLYYPPASPFDQPMAELVAQRWEAIGVKVNLNAGNLASLTEALFETYDWDVYQTGAEFTRPDQAVPWVSGPVPPEGVNYAGIDNPEYTELVAQAQATALPDACEYWNQAEQALWRHLDFVPLGELPLFYYLQGAQADVLGYDIPVPTSIRVLE